MKWEFTLKLPPWAGVLSTARGVVFGGSNEGNFYALDALSGKALWDFQTGGVIVANPISFLIDGKATRRNPSRPFVVCVRLAVMQRFQE